MSEAVNRITSRIDGNETTLLALVKGKETFVFMFDDAHREEVLRTFGRFASRTDMLNFTWYDAAILSSKVKDKT